MSAKSQHNNILLAIIGFAAVVVTVGVIGFFVFGQDDETIQGEVEVSEYRVSCKLPGRIVELRAKEGDYVHVGDTLAILQIPEIDAQKKVALAAGEATEALKDLTDAGARKEQIQAAYQLWQQAIAASEIARKTYTRMQNLYNEGVVTGQKRCPRAGKAYRLQKLASSQKRCGSGQLTTERNRTGVAGRRGSEQRLSQSGRTRRLGFPHYEYLHHE